MRKKSDELARRAYGVLVGPESTFEDAEVVEEVEAEHDLERGAEEEGRGEEAPELVAHENGLGAREGMGGVGGVGIAGFKWK